jgi:hypothetical protein
LLDILSKRERLYRIFLNKKYKLNYIPKFLTASPNHDLVKEIQATFPFIDPTTYSSEVTRELLYQNTHFLKFTFMIDFLKLTNNLFYQLPINFNKINNYFIYLLGSSDNYLKFSKNSNLYKSQYRPMKKGIMNMVRLQATNAVAMPTEIRLHILASSKDVIHS